MTKIIDKKSTFTPFFMFCTMEILYVYNIHSFIQTVYLPDKNHNMVNLSNFKYIFIEMIPYWLKLRLQNTEELIHCQESQNESKMGVKIEREV